MRGVQTYGRPGVGVTGENGNDTRVAYTTYKTAEGETKTALGIDPALPEGARVLVRVG